MSNTFIKKCPKCGKDMYADYGSPRYDTPRFYAYRHVETFKRECKK